MDSLGEAYLKYNQKEEAIKSYTKAVELGTESSRKTLTELLKKKRRKGCVRKRF